MSGNVNVCQALHILTAAVGTFLPSWVVIWKKKKKRQKRKKDKEKKK